MAGDAAVGAGAGGAVGSALGYFLTQDDRDQQRQKLADATQNFEFLNPGIDAQTVGNGDPVLREAQLEALNKLRAQYQSGGMDAQAKADQYATTQAADQNAQALQANVRSQMMQRGLASSGQNFAAQRQVASDAANRAYAGGLQAQAAGEQRALGAATGAAGVAGDMQSRQDAIARFNASQKQNAQQASYENQYQRAGGIAGSTNNEVNLGQKQDKQEQDFANGAGSAIGTAIGSFI